MDRAPPRWDHDPPLAHRVAHRLPGDRGADPLPPRLSAHRRPQPDPCQRPRTGRHAPDRTQEPGHLRPLQHHPRAGTARRRGPTRRLSGTAGTGDAPRARAPDRRRRHAHRASPPPRATHHRVRAHGPPATARGRGPGGGGGSPDTARLCAGDCILAPEYGPARDRGTRGDGAGRRGRPRARTSPDRRFHAGPETAGLCPRTVASQASGPSGPFAPQFQHWPNWSSLTSWQLGHVQRLCCNFGQRRLVA